jgi:hypothetical protein
MMCGEPGCVRASRARGLCEMHYTRLKRKGLDKLHRAAPRLPSILERLAQEGRNEQCVNCGGEPLFGGMRCLDCFRLRCEQRSSASARVG